MLKEPEFERPEEQQVNPFRSTMGIFQQVQGLKMILLLNIVRTFFIRIRTPLMQLYFHEVKNADVFVLAYQNTVSTGVTLLLGISIGNLDKRLGRRRMGYVSQIMYAVCVLAAVLTPVDRPIWLLVIVFLVVLGWLLMLVGMHIFMSIFRWIRGGGIWGLILLCVVLLGLLLQ